MRGLEGAEGVLVRCFFFFFGGGGEFVVFFNVFPFGRPLGGVWYVLLLCDLCSVSCVLMSKPYPHGCFIDKGRLSGRKNLLGSFGTCSYIND